MTELSRRDFAKLITAAGLGANLPLAATTSDRTVAIQVGAVSFVDEGVAPVLDRFQKDANINTLLIATFSYGRGIAGRQVPGQPLPDHGKQEYDTNFYGGNFARTHEQYYTRTPLKKIQAPDHPGFDVLESVLPEAKSRGMKTFCWYEDVFRGSDSHRQVISALRSREDLIFENLALRRQLPSFTRKTSSSATRCSAKALPGSCAKALRLAGKSGSSWSLLEQLWVGIV